MTTKKECPMLFVRFTDKSKPVVPKLNILKSSIKLGNYDKTSEIFKSENTSN